ncbi:protein arginine N-methyltransferase 6-like [Corticium candelabrum]|uniref:protein arginine N-methyltransferase 6-like n=1 Tax=Corticium candelabrum TaxID=121492 RepID=UPI002E2536A1|nr:protein arginine N-methyltransferase 6-like [Corticium candelabrum]
MSKRRRVQDLSDEAEGSIFDAKSEKFYFNVYSDASVHERMLEDMTRTKAYQDAIFKFSDAIKGKVVADVGAGTGILSMFCIQAGAKKVYAVEASDMAEQARGVIKANGMSEQIDVMQCLVEDCDLPEMVDVIVSEWMGCMLLYESMWVSLLCARDKWLKPNGLMWPSVTELHLAPITNEGLWQEKKEIWDSVNENYGVNMSSMFPFAWTCLCRSVNIIVLSAENVLARGHVIAKFDMATVKISDLEHVKSDFSFASMGRGVLHGFAAWFTAAFDVRQNDSELNSVVLTTSPYNEPTHWEHSVMYIEHPVTVDQDDIISGNIKITTNKKYSRWLDVQLTCRVKDNPEFEQKYTMNDLS